MTLRGAGTTRRDQFVSSSRSLWLWATQGLYAKKKPPLRPVNINTASAGNYRRCPASGPATAEKILDGLQVVYAPKMFVPGSIGRKKLEKMRKYLTVKKSVQNQRPSAQPAKNIPPKRGDAKPLVPKPTAGENEEP
jgi:hypothetical protein